MASSTSPVIEPTTPPWESLPPEITAAILQKLGAVEILMTAVKVCPTWWRVSKEYPSIWRCIDMQDRLSMYEDIDTMCRRAVDLSQGQLIDFKINGFGTDDLILYISQRSSQLKSLQLLNCRSISFVSVVEAITNFPLLEELHLQLEVDCTISVNCIETIAISCPLLKSLSLCDRDKYSMNFNSQGFYSAQVIECDKIAEAIAVNMPRLCQLHLIGNKLTYVGLKAILCGCPNLVSLDLRGCVNVFTCADVEQLCLERIKDLKLPNDSMDGYDFGADDDDDDDYSDYGNDCECDDDGYYLRSD